MDDPFLPLVGLVTLVPLVGALFMAVVVFLIVRTMTSGSRVTLPPPAADGSLTLNGHLRRPGEALTFKANWGRESFGTVTLSRGTFWWAGEDGARWAVPAADIAVLNVRSGFNLAGPGMHLRIRNSGDWMLTVSDKHINRISTNTAKTFREGATGQLFARALAAHGAQVAHS
ncbi:MAG: hypothetical protein U0Q15_01660 [Kineosporiaceae bacterium]